MEEFKEGDLVRIKSNCSGLKKGEIYPLHSGGAQGEEQMLYAWNNDVEKCGCSCETNWEKIGNKIGDIKAEDIKVGDRIRILKTPSEGKKNMKEEELKKLNSIIQVCKCGKVDASKNDGHNCEQHKYNEMAREFYD